jgi:hypothetical protein
VDDGQLVREAAPTTVQRCWTGVWTTLACFVTVPCLCCRASRRVAANPKWGPYLHARSHLVAQLADQVRLNTAGEAQAWAAQLHTLVSAELIADVQVWRAATARSWQQQLDNRLAAPVAQPRCAMAATARRRST